MKNIPYISYLPIIILSMLAYKMLDKIDTIGSIFLTILSILVPFIWAFVIAYLANPLLIWVEKKTNFQRGICLLIVYLVIISVLVLFFILAIPSLVNNLTDIMKNMPYYVNSINKTLTEQQDFWEKIGVNDALESMESMDLSVVKDFTKSIIEKLNAILSGMLNGVWGLTSGFFKFFIGLIISIYMLHGKENFKIGMKRFLYAIFDEKRANSIMLLIYEIDDVFSRYIVGKFIDSLIIGIIGYIGLFFLKVPYALLLSIIIGVTNLIPYFGPLIGAIPAVIITVFYSPIKAVWVAIFILALQQIDGYIIGPRILGDSVGMSPFWIILAIIIGGGLFGILGMLVGVPVMAVIRNLLIDYVSNKLKKKSDLKTMD